MALANEEEPSGHTTQWRIRSFGATAGSFYRMIITVIGRKEPLDILAEFRDAFFDEFPDFRRGERFP